MNDQSIRDRLDELSMKVIPMIGERSGRCQLDSYKVKAYRDILNVDDRHIFDQIISSTRYIDFNRFYSALIRVAESLPDGLYVYVNIDDPLHSETWCLVIVWPTIRYKVREVYTDIKKIDARYPLLIIDDAIYSGLRVGDLIADVLTFSLCNQLIVCAPYASVHHKQLVNCRLTRYGYQDRAQIEYVIGETIHPMGFRDDMDDEYLLRKFKASTLSLPLYFDHKIASWMSTFNHIYESCVTDLPDRKHLVLLSDL